MVNNGDRASEVMKNVLLITSNFPPATTVGAIRLAKFAKFLPEFGWNPLVLTVPVKNLDYNDLIEVASVYRAPAPSLAPLFALGRRFFPKRKVESTGKVNISSFQGRGPRLMGWFLVPDQLITWLPFAIIMGLKIARKYKIKAIVSSSPDQSCHLVARVLSKIFCCAWVADFRDPWAANPFLIYPTSFHHKINRFLERLVVNYADRITTVSEPLRNDFIAYYPDQESDKFRVITNGFDLDDFTGAFRTNRPDQCIRIVHNGKFFYAGKDPFPFLWAVKLLADNNELDGVKVHFVGVPVEKLKPVIQNMELEQIVELSELVPYRQSLKFVINADILLLVSGPGKGVLTTKVFEYLATAKPILALTPSNGALAHLLSFTNVAEIVDPDSPQAIADGLKKLIRQVRAGHMPTPNQDFILQFSRRNQTRLLAKYLDEAWQSLQQHKVTCAME